MFRGAEEHAASQSNPFFAAEKARARQAAVERSFEDTCDAAAIILRRLMEHAPGPAGREDRSVSLDPDQP